MKSPRHWALQQDLIVFSYVLILCRNEKPETLGIAT